MKVNCFRESGACSERMPLDITNTNHELLSYSASAPESEKNRPRPVLSTALTTNLSNLG